MSAQDAGLPVAAGVDGAEPALQAVRWAAREAGRRKVPLRLVTVCGWMTEQHPEGPGLSPEYREVLLTAARDRLGTAAAAARDAAPGIEVVQEVRPGFPAPVLTDESARTQLLVLSDRGLGGFTGLLFGSVAAAVTAHASSPVVVVRGSMPDRPTPDTGPVVVGVDGSPTSEAALAFAVDAAARRRAPLIAVHRAAAGLGQPGAAAPLALPGRRRPARRTRGTLMPGLGRGWVYRLTAPGRCSRAPVRQRRHRPYVLSPQVRPVRSSGSVGGLARCWAYDHEWAYAQHSAPCRPMTGRVPRGCRTWPVKRRREERTWW